MKVKGRLLNQHEVILYKANFYECTLIRGNQIIQLTRQSVCKQFGHEIGQGMHKGNMSENLDIHGPIFFGTGIK
jgi:hypothetical protein